MTRYWTHNKDIIFALKFLIDRFGCTVSEKQHFEYSDCTLTDNLDDRLAERVKCYGTFRKKKVSG